MEHQSEKIRYAKGELTHDLTIQLPDRNPAFLDKNQTISSHRDWKLSSGL
jgi:hypothetical protein